MKKNFLLELLMEKNIKEILEKSEKYLIEEDNAKKEENCKCNGLPYNFENDKNIKDLDFEKGHEIIKGNIFEEDKNEEIMIFNDILEDLNKNILINIKDEKEEDKNQLACNEILNILKYRRGVSLFKPLYKPKKISMIGKVFFNNADKINDNTSINVHNVKK